MIYIVTWNLNGENNYEAARQQVLNLLQNPALDAIKDSGLDSAYFVATNWTADQLYNHLSTAFDDDDRVIVVEILSGHYSGWLHQDMVDWINARL